MKYPRGIIFTYLLAGKNALLKRNMQITPVSV